jgi:hypothetical protein
LTAQRIVDPVEISNGGVSNLPESADMRAMLIVSLGVLLIAFSILLLAWSLPRAPQQHRD